MKKITPDDPRLTAYAVGHLPAEERGQIEAALADSAELRQFVQDTQALGESLRVAYAEETLPSLTEAQHERVALGLAKNPTNIARPFRWRPVVAWGLAASLAAAGLVAWFHDNQPAAVALAPSPAPADPAVLEKQLQTQEGKVEQARLKLLETAERYRINDLAALSNNPSISGDPVTGAGSILQKSMLDRYPTEARIGEVKTQIDALKQEGENPPELAQLERQYQTTVDAVQAERRKYAEYSEASKSYELEKNMLANMQGKLAGAKMDAQPPRTDIAATGPAVSQPSQPSVAAGALLAAAPSPAPSAQAVADDAAPPDLLAGVEDMTAMSGDPGQVPATRFKQHIAGSRGGMGGGGLRARDASHLPSTPAQPSALDLYATAAPPASVSGDPVTGAGIVLQKSMLRRYERETSFAQIKTQLDTLRGVGGEDKIKTAAMLDLKDQTLIEFYPQYNKLRIELDALEQAGLGANHPRRKVVHAKYEQVRRLLHEAVAGVEVALQRKLEMAEAGLLQPQPTPNTESYAAIVENPFRAIREAGDERSTFSIDVDTAAYSNVRRFLNAGQRPPANAVRLEEMINYFDYQYPEPPEGQPFAIDLEATAAPWAAGHRLVRIGLQGKRVATDERTDSNLVFLVDVSGSMDEPSKLPLLKQALRGLTRGLRGPDFVTIVTYAGSSGVALEPTSGAHQDRILRAINKLTPGGSTNGAGGITMAYDLAAKHHLANGVNRVILATDGDFNVGVTDTDALAALAAQRAKADKTFLTILGFGEGNLQDARMEQIANKANGTYHYIDNEKEGHKVLVTQMSGTLVTVAKDVKIQVEFNPAKVASYRLLGYENRALANRDFNDDSKDAGEIGAGHCVTALYEIVPRNGHAPGANEEPLKYRAEVAPEPAKPGVVVSDDLVTVRLRYKLPEAEESQKIETTLVDAGKAWAEASANTRWAAAVASFGMLLRGSAHAGTATFADVKRWAETAQEPDEFGWRKEFLELVTKAGF